MARGYGRWAAATRLPSSAFLAPLCSPARPRLAGSGPSAPRRERGSRRTALTGRWSLPQARHGPPEQHGDARPGQDVVDPEQCRPPAPVRRPRPPPPAEAQKSRRRSIHGPTRRSKLRCWRVALKSPMMTTGRAPEDGGAPGLVSPSGPGPTSASCAGHARTRVRPTGPQVWTTRRRKALALGGRDYGVELGVALGRPGLDVAEGHPADQRQPSGARTGVRLDAPPRVGRRG